MNEFQSKYLAEVSQRLRREGFTVCPEYAGLLPVEKDAHKLCNINIHGGISYDPEQVRRLGQEDALEQVRGAAGETLTYMRQMAAAPLLQADGLSGDYRLLAEFDNIVLAGHERSGDYGVEFITWERIQNGAGLWQGHYYENDYTAAKQDFAVRSGAVMREQIFTPEQLAEVYRSIHETLDNAYPITDGRKKLLEEASKQIEGAVPDLEQRVYQSNQAELELALRLEDGAGQGQGQTFSGF